VPPRCLGVLDDDARAGIATDDDDARKVELATRIRPLDDYKL
jgi:hypothetical protein